ncbi:FMN-dependent NADH-azoreductase [Phytopseudomonas punonensis]|uniref:FMN dependent NADH:quinone oxidoreductase n=1 Tax=Phytopseudomonas punonensis TaxID=1220495 RepID=A0A1M7D1B1_9GAMM|nr:NAD(P)H-dependent oxidoreductase [Pseudomonas punonensis]SHL73218.1 FMN-dependent NADH-azoreductase [Pseudomonas punonensis]
MKILHVDSSISGDSSLSKELSALAISHLRAVYPDAEVTYRDLVETPVNHLTGSIFAGFDGLKTGEFDAVTRQEHQLSERLVSEFLASNILVIGAPMYNFSISTQLKAWLDRIAQLGRTFNYTQNGTVGLAGGKCVIVVSVCGGFYSHGSQALMDFQEPYLCSFFKFLGINDIRFVRAEGTMKGELERSEGIKVAKAALSRVY